MPRRAFLALVATAAGGGLFFAARGVEYELTRRRVIAMTHIQTITPMPAPITRAEWGARAVNHEAINESGTASATNPTGWLRYPDDLSAVYHTVAIHHSALARRRGETMRSIQDFHMGGRGWADIGYHFGIDAEGRLYAGRDLHARGASVAGGNSGMIGVVVMGNFEWETPSDAQLTTLQTLIVWLTETYGLTRLAGHAELNAGTVCPGRFLRLYLDLLAQGAGLARP